jgi:small subunit ribosomal protein S7
VPRKGNIPKREVLPDPVYNDVKVSKLINNIMLDGKKGVAQKICYGAFDIIKERTGEEPIDVFYKALDNVMPDLECKARRVGGANYQIPMEVRPDRKLTLGLRWIVNFSRSRSERTMKERLAAELMDAANGTGGAFKKKEEMHRMAEANKAFAHYNR